MLAMYKKGRAYVMVLLLQTILPYLSQPARALSPPFTSLGEDWVHHE